MARCRLELKNLRVGWTRGQSLVEFALVLPVFFLLLFGAVDFGRGIASFAVVSNCAREGARAGIFAGSSYSPGQQDAEILAAINSQASMLGTIPSSSVTIAPADQSARKSGTNISVTVTYTFRPITPLIGAVVGSGIAMTASSTMMIE